MVNRKEKLFTLRYLRSEVFALGYQNAEDVRYNNAIYTNPYPVGTDENAQWWAGFFENCADSLEDPDDNAAFKWRQHRAQNIKINGSESFYTGYLAAEAERATGRANQNPYEWGTQDRERWYNGFGCNCSDYLNGTKE